MSQTELPIKIQAIVYRQPKRGETEILLLKRSPEDGGFWQMLTGTLEFNESIEETLLRELKEETGIIKPLAISEEVYRFNWQKQDYTVVEMVYGVKVATSVEVVLSHEHQDYQWLPLSQASEYFTHQSSTTALQAFREIVLE